MASSNKYSLPFPLRDLEKEVGELSASKQSLERERTQDKVVVDSLRSQLQSQCQGEVEALTKKCQENEEKLGKLGRCSMIQDCYNSDGLYCCPVASQAVVIAKHEEEVKAKLHSVDLEHQERLESLTNKCLAFEEELCEC